MGVGVHLQLLLQVLKDVRWEGNRTGNKTRLCGQKSMMSWVHLRKPAVVVPGWMTVRNLLGVRAGVAIREGSSWWLEKICLGAEFTEMRQKPEYFNQILEDCTDGKDWVILIIGACGLLHLPSVDFSVPSLKQSNIYMPFILYSNTCEEKDIFGADRMFLHDINIYTLFLGDHTFLILSSLIFDAYEGCYGCCINCTTHGILENSFLISMFIKV